MKTNTLDGVPSTLNRGYPETIPTGWYFIDYSSTLKIEEVRTVRYFGQEWVLFRNQNNQVGILEPYCPHLGAHIGKGGKIDGSLIRCPFHAWGFDNNGFCKNIPYTSNMPPLLKKQRVLRALPVIEKNGIIWAWYHPKDNSPAWAVTDTHTGNLDNWTKYKKYQFEIDTSTQDIAENTIDYAHMKYVHGQSATLEGTVSYDGISRKLRYETNVNVLSEDNELIPCRYTIDLYQQGPGLTTIKYHREVELVMLLMTTPITNQKTLMSIAFTHPKYDSEKHKIKLINEMMQEKIGQQGSINGFEADIPIWNNKIYREKPFLCNGDGPIMRFRSWFKQFYDGIEQHSKV